LFKIIESVISFCLKKNYNLAILNMWESFSGMVDHVTCPQWESYNFSGSWALRLSKNNTTEWCVK